MLLTYSIKGYYNFQFCMFLSQQITKFLRSGVHQKLPCMITSSQINMGISFTKLPQEKKINLIFIWPSHSPLETGLLI
jgi:hypothetical protein